MRLEAQREAPDVQPVPPLGGQAGESGIPNVEAGPAERLGGEGGNAGVDAWHSWRTDRLLDMQRADGMQRA